MTKLMIIRGPSGVGKSTVARELWKRSDRPTLMVEQDQFRPNFNKKSPRDKLPIWEIMIEGSVLTGLKNGYDVIMEGILNIQKPGRIEAFERLFNDHQGENYIFYMDASFEETARRHNMRHDKRQQFGAEEMREWYDLASPMKHAEETIIPESSTFEETVDLMAKKAGLNLKPA